MSNNTSFTKRKIITSDIIQLFQWNVIDLIFVSSVSPLASDKSIPFSSLLLLFNAKTFDIEQSFHQQKFDFPKQISFFDNHVETESSDIVFANDNEFYLYNNLIELKKQNSSCFNIYIVQNKATKNNQFIIELNCYINIILNL